MFRTAYGERNRVATSFLDEEGNPLPTMTQQNFKAECEINNILRRYDRDWETLSFTSKEQS